MKKIAYIELDTHAEIAANFMELLQDSQQFQVDYFFSDKILKQLQLEEKTNIIKADSGTLLQKLSQNHYDFVIIGTAHRYFNTFLKVTEKYNTSVIVHNLNFAHITKSALLKIICKEDFFYRLKLLLKEGLLTAPQVFSNVKNLLVLDESLQSKRFNFLPLFYTKFREKNDYETLTVVIPGAVSQKRRNYEHVLANLVNFRKRAFFVFLGKAENPELKWLQEFEKSKPTHIKIHYFTEKVPQSEFDKWMKKADLLWCPIQRETTFFSQPEIYGETKMSGNIGDAIKYSKPAVFPVDYFSEQPFIIKKRKEELDELFFEVKAQDYDFSDFSKKKVQQKLEQILQKLILA